MPRRTSHRGLASLNDAVCTVEHLNHVCIAVRDIDETLKFYGELFGVGSAEVEEIEEQGVRAALLKVGDSQLEFIEPTDPAGGVAQFIERRGEGLHHICFEVDGLEEKLQHLAANDVQLIDQSPRPGLAGMIAFIHPRATRGVLIELVDRESGAR